jgi:hypothetical protein
MVSKLKILTSSDVTNLLFICFMTINFLWHYKIIP